MKIVNLSLKKLWEYTPAYFKKSARDVVVKVYTKCKSKGGYPAIQAVTKPFDSNKIQKCSVVGKDKSIDSLLKQKQVIVSCDCLTADTEVRVVIDNKIQDIAINQLLNKPTVQYSVNGVYYSGSAPFFVGRKKVFAIRLSNGRTLKATEDHKLLRHIDTKFKYGWIGVKSLTIGAMLVGDAYERIEVLSLEEMGIFEVYDITVPHIHRFVAEGIVVHNCDSFKYTYEYANFVNGCSVIKYSNGQPATVTNPHNIPGLCRHLVALVRVIKDNKD